MSLEVAAFGKILSPVATAVAPKLLKAVQSKLNPSELERALRDGLVEAQTQEQEQLAGQRLFSKYEPDFIPRFLHQLFEDAGVQAELQKPLKNEGMPDDAFLEKAFLRIAEQREAQLMPARVRPWIKTFTSTYFERTSAYLKFQVAKENYFEQLIHCFKDVRFAGIDLDDQEIERSEKLVEIFVMPDVQTKAQTEFSILEQGLPPEIKGNLQAQVLWEQRQRSQFINSQASQPKFAAAKLLNQTQAQRLVLLGAPGSGKTTLMSYFAVQLAQQKADLLGLDPTVDWLPILVKIRDFVKQPELNLLKYAQYMVKEDLGLQSLPPDFFEHWLKDGRALILLDGLDEVANEAKRYKVVERIESFLATHSRNHAIITSRPAGYKPDFFRVDEFPHYEILPFDDDQIQLFVDRWYDNRCSTKAEAIRRKESLKQAFDKNNRIKLLARNPLLLTIITLIHRYQAVLPKERHKLYDKAVNTLLKTWDANKELTDHKILQYLELDDLRRLMEQLAYWIHSQGGTGDNEGGTLIERDELINQLSQYIQKMKKIERHCAKAEAERFLDQIVRDRAGLLSKQGRDRYAFVHKTFQEYLTTQEIRDRQEEGFGVVLDHIQDHLHDPHWREVLLLLIAQQKRGNPTKALQRILDHPTLYEQWLHRNLLFASTCLTENITVEESLVEDILTQLVELEVSQSPLVPYVIRNRVFQILCDLGETQYEAQALQQLEASEDIDKVRLSEYQAALGKLEEAIQKLISLLKDEDNDVRSSAASALGRIGKGSEAVVEALLPLLKDGDNDVRSRAASLLGWIGKGSEVVIDALLLLLKDEDNDARSSAASALGRIGKGSEAVVEALLSLLKDGDNDVRSSAAFVLGQLCEGSEAAVSTLLPLLKDEDDDVRSSAASALGRIGKGSEAVVEALLPLLKDEDNRVRLSSASALEELGEGSEAVVNTLLPLLKDEDDYLQLMAVFALERIGKDSEAVVDALLPLLKDEDNDVRSSVAFVLGRIGKGSEAVVDALLPLLKDEDNRVRSSATFALGRIGRGSEVVIDALLPLLKDEDNRVRSRAASGLGELGKGSEAVVDALLPLLKDENNDVRLGAASALGELGKGSEAVIVGLLLLLRDEDDDVRSSATFALEELSNTDNAPTHFDYITITLNQWIEQNQVYEHVGNAVQVLWTIMSEEIS